MLQFIAQATTQPAPNSILTWMMTTSPERVAIVSAAWFLAVTAILAGSFKLAKYFITEWFDTKKLIRQQAQSAQAITSLIDINKANPATPAVDPMLESAVRVIGTGDGTKGTL